MHNFRDVVYVSNLPSTDRQLYGAEARDVLYQLGYTHVYVDDAGQVFAISPQGDMCTRHKVYVKSIPASYITDRR